MSLGFISDSGFTLVIGHRSNDELICVMVGAGGKNLKIISSNGDISDFDKYFEKIINGGKRYENICVAKTSI